MLIVYNSVTEILRDKIPVEETFTWSNEIRQFQITSQIAHKPLKGVKSSFVHYIRSQESLTENEALSTVVDLLVGATETVGLFKYCKLGETV